MASCTRGGSYGAAFDFRLNQSTGGATQNGQVQPGQLKEKQPTPFPRGGVENTCTIVHLSFSASTAGGRISFGLPLFPSMPCAHPPTTSSTGILFPSSWAFQEAQRGLASVLLPPDASLGAEGKRKAAPVNPGVRNQVQERPGSCSCSLHPLQGSIQATWQKPCNESPEAG